MKNYALPYFGELNLEDLEEYYYVEVEFGGHKIEIDLNFESKTIEFVRLDIVKKFIEDLERHNLKNYAAIKSDFKDGANVAEYIKYHIDEFDTDELSTIIDAKDKKVSPEQQMLSKIHLMRIGLYPNSEDRLAVFDYSIGRKFTDQLIVVLTNQKGDLDRVTMES